MSVQPDLTRDDSASEAPHALRRQRTGMALVVTATAAMLCALPMYDDFVAPLRAPDSARASLCIDPNTADWHELAQLPGIGEALARRIVAFRDNVRASGDIDRPIFSSPGDLRRVSGIGDQTIHEVAPYLRFPAVAPGGLVDRAGPAG